MEHKAYVVGRGSLGGCWADKFWVVSPDGLERGRKLLRAEKQELIQDYYRYREYLAKELKDVYDAEEIILNAQVYSPEIEAKILKMDSK